MLDCMKEEGVPKAARLFSMVLNGGPCRPLYISTPQGGLGMRPAQNDALQFHRVRT